MLDQKALPNPKTLQGCQRLSGRDVELHLAVGTILAGYDMTKSINQSVLLLSYNKNTYKLFPEDEHKDMPLQIAIPLVT